MTLRGEIEALIGEHHVPHEVAGSRSEDQVAILALAIEAIADRLMVLEKALLRLADVVDEARDAG